MPQAPEPLRLGDAALLGALHGPTELLPISSSGHTTLISELAGLNYAKAPSQQRKPLEIALHAGTAAALLLFPPAEGCGGPRGLKGLAFRGAMLAPTAVAGLAGRNRVRDQLGTTATISAGLLAGSVAMVTADRSRGTRTATDASIVDGLAIGGLQALAIWPGVSRSAMAITAARWLGFSRGASARLSRSGLVATSLAAASLEGVQLAREGIPRQDLPALAVAAAGGFVSAVVARPMATRMEMGAPLWPWALWRTALATVTVLRIRATGDDGHR
ncbi:MAG: hypothetical protein F2799_03335 [Actinobacteria bacterium]|nr:hypothetical protein [Actinomycetota bacterium]